MTQNTFYPIAFLSEQKIRWIDDIHYLNDFWRRVYETNNNNNKTPRQAYQFLDAPLSGVRGC